MTRLDRKEERENRWRQSKQNNRSHRMHNSQQHRRYNSQEIATQVVDSKYREQIINKDSNRE